VALGDETPLADGTSKTLGIGVCGGSRPIGSVRISRKPSSSVRTSASGWPSSTSAARTSSALGRSAKRTFQTVPPVKSTDGFRPPRAMKISPGIVIRALKAKYQLRLPTMSNIAQRSTW